MLKVQFLGLNGSIQEKSSSNTSFLLSVGKEMYLVDVSGNLFEATTPDLKGVILTHSHIDHIYALPSLLHQLWLKGRKEELVIYASTSCSQIAEELIKIFKLREKKGMFQISLKTMDSLDSSFIPFKTDHTDDSWGFVVRQGDKKLIYTSDTRAITDILPDFYDADVLITEASGTQDDQNLKAKGHQSGKEAGLIAERIRAKKLFLVHLPCGDDVKKSIKKEAKEVFANTEIPSVLGVYEVK